MRRGRCRRRLFAAYGWGCEVRRLFQSQVGMVWATTADFPPLRATHSSPAGLSDCAGRREAASGGVQQSSVARTERREAELRAEKSEKAVRRLAEKNKQLHAAVAEREKEIAELRRAAEKKERFVGVKKAVYVPEVKDDDGIPGVDSDEDDDDDEVAEVVEEEEEDGDEEEDDSSDEESD